jgi:hypothetical protein
MTPPLYILRAMLSARLSTAFAAADANQDAREARALRSAERLQAARDRAMVRMLASEPDFPRCA